MNQTVFGYQLDQLKEGFLGEPFNQVCREAAAEGAVLLKNDDCTLPFSKGTAVAVFGRIQNYYYKSGTGSGGAVRTDHVVGILQGLQSAGLRLDETLCSVYREWHETHPIDQGSYYVGEPWSQAEMPVTEELVDRAARENDAAIVIIGRTAGEGHDNACSPGSFLLTETEEDLLQKVTSAFQKVVVVLNVGNVIDMEWVQRYNPSAVLYVWQGGQEGGDAVGDVITGRVNPSGRLTDTIARSFKDCPYYANFGDETKNVYAEDIYVGYRYFNTFARENIRYPFGYGLSYTTFEMSSDVSVNQNNIAVRVGVTNTGRLAGKQVVQVYCSAPQGLLEKPALVLVGFAKTSQLQPGQTETVQIAVPINEMASFDDTGITGYKHSYVLEAGDYGIYIGDDSLSAERVFTYNVPQTVAVKQCSSAMAPQEDFERYKPCLENQRYTLCKEPVRGRSRNGEIPQPPAEIPYTGDRGIKLIDVKEGKHSMAEFIAQLSDRALVSISLGEGMNSPKVTGGTACAFGGVIQELLDYGVPIACGTDGPSGIRLDTGAKATSMPCGTLLACTWNEELVERLYTYEGIEMVANRIDLILGPGINIHRHPLNGRNFEYFSEDPHLTGRMAAAVCRGIAKSGVSGTVKHFCANNQEYGRGNVDTVVSERALREIYLRPFETVIKAGDCRAVMTAYNRVNGVFCSANADMNTRILRDEWGFQGLVMTDWWAKTQENFRANNRTAETEPMNLKIMVEAQNDIYMVRVNAADYDEHNLLSSLVSGEWSRGYIQRNAINICNYLMHSRALERFVANGGVNPIASLEDLQNAERLFRIEEIQFGTVYPFTCDAAGRYLLKAVFSSKAEALSQNNIFVFSNGAYKAAFTTCGTDGQKVTEVRDIELDAGENRIRISCPSNMLLVHEVGIYRKAKKCTE